MLHLALVALLALVVPASAQPFKIFGAHITTQTTTTLVAGIAARSIALISMSACVDGNGAVTSITIQDSAGTNLLGTGVVYVVNPGSCFSWPFRGATAANAVPQTYLVVGNGLQLVTGTGNGPVEVYGEFLQQ